MADVPGARRAQRSAGISAMLNDVSLPAIDTVHAGGVPAIQQRTFPEEPVRVVSAAPPILNPTLRLDAVLGLVVIEFRNQSGAVTTSIPSQRQLQAYQRWEATRFGPAPYGQANARATTDVLNDQGAAADAASD
jgi:hypothetical protein